MSYLDRLKAKQVPNPFVSFGRASGSRAFDNSDLSVGFVGDEGIGVCENQPSPAAAPASPFLEPLQTKSKSEVFRFGGAWGGSDAVPQTYPPQAPSKPTKAFPDLHEPQADPNRCHVCGERETASRLFIAVLTDRPGAHHWLHAACHPEHSRRCAERRTA